MNTLDGALKSALGAQLASTRPLAVVLAGHNGSGKSTMWYRRLAPRLQIPLVNADRMMLSVLPEAADRGKLPKWAQSIRDTDQAWMKVAQAGVQGFVAQAMAAGVPFAFETVFSHWKEREDGSAESKIDTIVQMQEAGYFVLLLFVGLSDVQLSIARVATRLQQGGHDVPLDRLRTRFPRTQKAIGLALPVADAAILVDNSRSERSAFTPCRVQLKTAVRYDCREAARRPPRPVLRWLDVVSPRA